MDTKFLQGLSKSASRWVPTKGKVRNELLSFTKAVSHCGLEMSSRGLAEGSSGAIMGVIWDMVRN